ncbi:hypothetical protein [Candidatus Absconditicoccus praedator]|uniref:hypothetical protein n=1 Tax=Candidatus Absconditicoccus praedator TaxID=2735562 RepID=UPI001E53D536|nr:hypothetical protein [Candidatus Absconditicoccus praedator]UFX82705.1 hypothetical protein HLG78_00950 [Candidatus Absconditicoccus praedator]
MNYFEIKGLVQKGGGQAKLNMLFSGTDETEIKEILKNYGIVVFSVNKYYGKPEDFGSVEFTFEYEENNYSGVIDIGRVRDCFHFLTEIGFSIKYINSLKKPVDNDKVKIILGKLYKELEDEKKAKEETEKTKSKLEDDSKYSIKDLENIRKIIEETLNDYEELLERVDGKVSPADVKKIGETAGELKKLRMGSNIEKMSGVMESLLFKMESIELEYINSIKKEETGKYITGAVSDLDFIMEYDKYKRAKKVKTMSNVTATTKTLDDYYYGVFGRLGIYLKFLYKEIYNKAENYISLLNKSFWFFEIVFIFVLIEFVLYMLYSIYAGSGIYLSYYFIWNFGLLGILVYIGKFFKSFSIFNIVVIYLFIIILYFIVRGIFINTFGL